MISVLPWLESHPALVVTVAWPLLTAAVNLAWQDASEYAERHPRFAAWKKLAQKWGLSPRGTLLLLRQLAIGKNIAVPPSLPPPAITQPEMEDSKS